MTIEKYIADWDPIKFISEGAPHDEYNAEAHEISRRFDMTMSDDDLAQMICDVFQEYMEIQPDYLRQQSLERSAQLREILSAR